MTNTASRMNSSPKHHQGTHLNGQKWVRSFRATNTLRQTALPRATRRHSSRHERRSLRLEAALFSGTINRESVVRSTIQLPRAPKSIGAWSLKGANFESYSPFDSRFPVMKMRKQRESSLGFRTFSPFDSRFPQFFESYSPFDSRFPNGPVEPAFVSYSPFDSRFPGLKSRKERDTSGFKTFSPFDERFPKSFESYSPFDARFPHGPVEAEYVTYSPFDARFPSGSSVTTKTKSIKNLAGSNNNQGTAPLALPIPAFSPSARTNQAQAASPRAMLGWIAPAQEAMQQSPLSAILQRFTGYGSPAGRSRFHGIR